MTVINLDGGGGGGGGRSTPSTLSGCGGGGGGGGGSPRHCPFTFSIPTVYRSETPLRSIESGPLKLISPLNSTVALSPLISTSKSSATALVTVKFLGANPSNILHIGTPATLMKFSSLRLGFGETLPRLTRCGMSSTTS